MVDTIGQAKGHPSSVSEIMDHKIVPWLIAALAYFGAQALETFQGNDAEMAQTVQAMQVDLAIVKQRTEQFADNAPNRWTRSMHNEYASENDRRFAELQRRIELLEASK